MALAATKRFSLNATVQLLLATGLFIVATLLARDAMISDAEKNIFTFIYGWPEWLHIFFLSVTQLGSVYLLIVMSILVALRTHYHVLIRLLMTGMLAYLLSGVAKDLVGRPRPIELIVDVVHRDYFVRGPGYPSGHVALATAMAFCLVHYAPKKFFWAGPLIILGVALSRIYLGVHAPLDVVGGFAIGWASYALFRHVKLIDLRKNPQASSKKLLKKPASKHKLK